MRRRVIIAAAVFTALALAVVAVLVVVPQGS